MRRINSGWVLAGAVLLTVLSATASMWCSPVGLNDLRSASGFAVLTLFFFIQSMIFSSTLRFDEGGERALWEYLGEGINKLVAMVALLVSAVPHPEFTGVLLWLGVSFLLLNSGVRDIGHVVFTFWKRVEGDLKEWRAEKQREKEELAMAAVLKEQEAKVLQGVKAEKDLFSDLADFLNSDDSSDKDKR